MIISNSQSPNNTGGDSQQLELGVKYSRFEWWYNLKSNFLTLERTFENLPFWRSWINCFAVVTVIMLWLVSGTVLALLWDEIPDEVPIFYSQLESNWNLYPKYVLLLLALLIALLESILFFVAFRLFAFDKRLAVFLNLILIIIGFLYLMALAQIISLTLL